MFGESSQKVWDIVLGELEPLTPPDAFEATKEKIASFATGHGTILFYEDQAVVQHLQEQFALYKDNFPIWSEQSTGIAQHSVWVALSEVGLGATIQHYNPLIDEKVAELFEIPETWKLTWSNAIWFKRSGSDAERIYGLIQIVLKLLLNQSKF